MKKISVLSAAGLTAASALLAAAPAHAGVDGQLNNPDVLDHVSPLNTNINSDPLLSETRNENTRADGDRNNSPFQLD